MLNATQLNTLACRAIARMRESNSDTFNPHPQIDIQRPPDYLCNDIFCVYWQYVFLGYIQRPGCARDWEFNPNKSTGSTFLRFFDEAIKSFLNESANRP